MYCKIISLALTPSRSLVLSLFPSTGIHYKRRFRFSLPLRWFRTYFTGSPNTISNYHLIVGTVLTEVFKKDVQRIRYERGACMRACVHVYIRTCVRAWLRNGIGRGEGRKCDNKMLGGEVRKLTEGWKEIFLQAAIERFNFRRKQSSTWRSRSETIISTVVFKNFLI